MNTDERDNMLLRVGHLNVRYRQRRRTVHAVKDVSFTVPRGSCLGVVGESGSGKSTLARAVLALESADVTGDVVFAGQPVGRLVRADAKAFRRRAQMIFQDPLGSLNPRMTIGSAMAEVLRVHRLARTAADARRQAEEWLALVGLDAAYAARFPHELSGGQRQRANLARALCVGAEFLVADEPVSALDVGVQAQILNLLKDLQAARGITWMLIGHDMAVMRYMADHLLVMKGGEIVEQGETEQVLSAPQHPYTRELLSAVPDVDRLLADRAG